MELRFSVLMSVYKNDNPTYLRDAIESIYDNQSLKPNQVVIVKDGDISKEVEEILFEYKSKYKDIFDIITLKKNVGLGEALQRGLKYCKYEYIARMDSDDISVRDRFYKQVEYLKVHPKIDVLGGQITEFNEEINESNLRVRKVPCNNKEIKAMCKRRNPMNHVSIFMKKDALINCGGYKSLLLLEDYYLWIRMITQGYVFENINESLVYVRVGNGFDKRRGDRTRILGWKKLQDTMLAHKMINRKDSILNMIYIYGFVYSPKFVRKMAYSIFLRRKG